MANLPPAIPSCVRCRIPLEHTWPHKTCGLCKKELATMHAAVEYRMFNRTYYTCSLEGTLYTWLINHPMYIREITVTVPKVQVPNVEGQVHELSG